MTVVESTINAVYWFRMCCVVLFGTVRPGRLRDRAAFYYTFKFIAILWMALPQTKYAAVFSVSKVETDLPCSGAQIVFHSVLEPLFARYFKQAGTSENLRSQAAKSQ